MNKHKDKTISVSSAKTSPTSAKRSHVDRQLLVDVDNLTVTVGLQRVINQVSFCMHAGEFIGLIGPNGAGKTTLLRALLGLIRPAQGRIVRNTARIGYIPQRGFMQNNQIPLNVTEVVKLGARGVIVDVTRALEEVGMSSFAGKRFTELSGGQQQRVLIAKALAAHPDLLILDEPTTGIDEQSQIEFNRILAHLHCQGITIVMVSHDIDMVLKQVKRVICLNQTILYDGSPEHFDADQYLPKFYANQHRLLHHTHGEDHV